MTLAELLTGNYLIVLGAFVALWAISLRLRDASIVDIAWGMAFVLLAWSAFALTGGPRDGDPRRWLLVGLTTIWGLRLSLYLAWRNIGKGEDYRYQAMRRQHGRRFPWVSLGTVFALQASIAWAVSLPLQVAPSAPATPIGLVEIVGICVFGVGLAFEAVGDWQMARFKADPANAGQVMDRGLWRYTRHPNYFGDSCVWWGLYLIAAPADAWWTAIGPLIMTFFLLRVSGVTLLERSLKKRRPGYDAYIARTSAFIPWPPKPGG